MPPTRLYSSIVQRPHQVILSTYQHVKSSRYLTVFTPQRQASTNWEDRSHHRTNSRPALPLSSLPFSEREMVCERQVWWTKPVVHRPFFFQSNRIPNSGNNLSSEHRHQSTSNQPLCHRHISGLHKAFDTVRHSTLMEKLAQLHLPDYVYNWLADRSLPANCRRSLEFALYCLPW